MSSDDHAISVPAFFAREHPPMTSDARAVPAAKFNMTAGRFCWHALRDAVKLARVRGYDVELIEGPGFWEREFRVQGDAAGVRLVHAALVAWDKATS